MRQATKPLVKADPNLNVVSGKNKKGQDNWEKARGVTCAACGDEALRVIEICPSCFNILMDYLDKSRLSDREKQVVNFIRARYSGNLKSRRLASQLPTPEGVSLPPEEASGPADRAHYPEG